MKKLLFLLVCFQLTYFTNAQVHTSTSFDHVALSVKNLNKSANFYKQIIGLKEIKNRGEKEGIRWFSLNDGKELHLISTIKGKIKQNKAVHFAIGIKNFQEFTARLEKHNISYTSWKGKKNTITTRADGIKQLYIQDPDNYWIEVNSVSKKEDTQSITTLYFIRHAEKDRSDTNNKNPHLTKIGKQRAEKWSEVLKNISFDKVYSTNYYRTIETATPTAKINGLKISYYDPKSLNIKGFLNENEGKNVLVVGHSNTTPAFVNSILNNKRYQDIEDSNNANLYVINVFKDTITSSLYFID